MTVKSFLKNISSMLLFNIFRDLYHISIYHVLESYEMRLIQELEMIFREKLINNKASLFKLIIFKILKKYIDSLIFIHLVIIHPLGLVLRLNALILILYS